MSQYGSNNWPIWKQKGTKRRVIYYATDLTKDSFEDILSIGNCRLSNNSSLRTYMEKGRFFILRISVTKNRSARRSVFGFSDQASTITADAAISKMSKLTRVHFSTFFTLKLEKEVGKNSPPMISLTYLSFNRKKYGVLKLCSSQIV